MNPVGQFAMNALDKAMDANPHGEIKGLCASWSCSRFGDHDHCYFTCPVCNENFSAWLRRGKKVAA